MVASAGHPPPLMMDGDGEPRLRRDARLGSAGGGALRAYEELEPDARAGRRAGALHRRAGRAPRRVARRRARAAAAAVVSAGREARHCATRIIGAMLPQRAARRRRGAAGGARAAPPDDPLEPPSGRRGDDPAHAPRARALAATRPAPRERTSRRSSLACLGGLCERDRARLRPGAGVLEVRASIVGARASSRRRARLRELAPARGSHRGRGMLLMNGLMDSVDVDSRRRRHHGRSSRGAWGPGGMSAHPPSWLTDSVGSPG